MKRKGQFIGVLPRGYELRFNLSNGDKVKMQLHLSKITNLYYAYVRKNGKNIPGQQQRFLEIDKIWRDYVKRNFYPFNILYADMFSKHMGRIMKRTISSNNKKSGVKVLKHEKPLPDKAVDRSQEDVRNQEMVKGLLS